MADGLGITEGLSSINPLANVNLGSIGTYGTIALIIGVAFLLLILIGVIVWIFVIKKQYYINIHLFKLVGNNPTRVAIYKAKEVPFGLAGDRLWRVAPPNVFSMPFKIIKWLPIGKFQTAPHEFWYWLREDGEWINFRPTDIDKASREINVKFVQEDMRLSRLSTEKLLQQRLLGKSFWEKYGIIIQSVIFFLIIAISLVIIFYQYSTIVEKTGAMIDKASALMEKSCPSGQLVPSNAIFLLPLGLLFKRFRKWTGLAIFSSH